MSAFTRRETLFGTFALALLARVPRVLPAEVARPDDARGYDAWAEFPNGLRYHTGCDVSRNGCDVTVRATFAVQMVRGAVEFGVRIPGDCPRTEFSYRFDEPFYPIDGSYEVLVIFTRRGDALRQLERSALYEKLT